MVRREELGKLLLYTLILGALGMVLAAGLLIHASGATEELRATVLGGSLVAGLGLAYGARRDLDTALNFCIGIGLSVATIALVYQFSTDDSSPAARFLIATGLAIGAGAGIWTFLRRISPSQAPDVLGRSYPDLEAQEIVGIQFVAHLQEAESTGPHTAVLVLQNCYDAPRRVVVKLDAAGDRKYLRHPGSVEVELGGAQVTRVGIPVVSPDYEGSYRLYFDLAVSGSGGTRVRRWRRPPAPKRVTLLQSLLLLLFAQFHFGGGIYFAIPRLHRDLWNHPLPDVSRKVLWDPSSHPFDTFVPYPMDDDEER